MFFDSRTDTTDTPSIESAISRREGILLSSSSTWPSSPWSSMPADPVVRDLLARAQLAAAERQAEWERFARENARFVFVQPASISRTRPPPQGRALDQDRAAAHDRAAARRGEPDAVPARQLDRARGGAGEERAKGRGPGETAGDDASAVQDGGERQGTDSASIDSGRSAAFVRPDGGAARAPSAGGSLGDALRNLQRYVQGQSFDNPRAARGPLAGDPVRHEGVEFGRGSAASSRRSSATG